MDKAKVDQGIELLIKRLPERPEWVVIVDRSGLVLPEDNGDLLNKVVNSWRMRHASSL